MCYLLAKKYDKPGCIAIEANRGPELAELVTDLSKRTFKNHVQIVTVTSMEAYSEYKPYTILPTKGDFVKQVLKM